jgi:hypothetical protein
MSFSKAVRPVQDHRIEVSVSPGGHPTCDRVREFIRRTGDEGLEPEAILKSAPPFALHRGLRGDH